MSEFLPRGSDATHDRYLEAVERGPVVVITCPEPLGCGHDGLYSTYPRADGGSQCTACANAMRAAYDYTGRDPIRP